MRTGLWMCGRGVDGAHTPVDALEPERLRVCPQRAVETVHIGRRAVEAERRAACTPAGTRIKRRSHHQLSALGALRAQSHGQTVCTFKHSCSKHTRI